MLLGCIADDITGATDLALTLKRSGLRTIQVMGVPEDAEQLEAFDAVVIALKSRTNPVEEAIEWWLRGRYGVGPRGNGLLKFTDPNGQLALMMPVAPVHLDQPPGEGSDQTAPTWEPQYERRHQYIWQGENRDLQFASFDQGSGRADQSVNVSTELQGQVVW